MEEVADEFKHAVVAGLSAPLKSIECKYLYDKNGSKLFDQICDTPEYYPTRTEIQILTDCAGEIAATVGKGTEIIEYGSGSGLKTRLLLQAFNSPRAYMPVDISAEYLWRVVAELGHDFPKLDISPVAADFTKNLQIERFSGPGNRLLFFPGSTIGNFETTDAINLLSSSLQNLRPDYFVVGFDLVKDRKILEEAYDDAEGITAAFNLNMLRRINTELGGTFNISDFRHEARYNEIKSRVEMHIVSLKMQNVSIGDLEWNFAPGESIHTENCHKYTLDSFEIMVADAGWRIDRVWADENDYFAVALLRPAKVGK